MHLPYRIPVSPSQKDSVLRVRELLNRATKTGNNSNVTIIIVGVVVAVVVVAVMICVIWKSRRNSKSRNARSKRYAYAQTNGDDDSTPSTGRRAPRTRAGNSAASSQPGGAAGNMTSTVDRNTSVRSVMTLPAYNFNPNENELVLGREGERGGVDVVVEMPTAEEHETLRDEEMETMYQIRVARREQIADREERRQLRREARQRGDAVALRELSERARAASQSNVVTELREEQQRIREQRSRAVSSVSYDNLGIARHDGTRLRANSRESERVGLLSDAASIALSNRSPSALSHRRDRSTSSVLSFDSTQDFPSPGFPRSGATTPRRLSAQHTGGTAGSSPEIIGEADLGELELPPHDPPRYDDVSLEDARSGATTPVNFNEPPPDYSGPSQERDRRLSAQVADMVDNVDVDGDLSTRASSRLSRNSSSSSRPIPFPRLPSLSMETIPQIVVEPSSAYPRDRSRDR